MCMSRLYAETHNVGLVFSRKETGCQWVDIDIINVGRTPEIVGKTQHVLKLSCRIGYSACY
jgi:hypothetical protein